MTQDSRLTQVLGLVGWLALAFVAAAVGGFAAADAPTFYAQLALPSWAPPAGAFGPVWTVLYTLMGIAAWLVWRERRVRPAAPALALFGAQLAVNALWSWFFFAWKSGVGAFVAHAPALTRVHCSRRTTVVPEIRPNRIASLVESGGRLSRSTSTRPTNRRTASSRPH